MSGQNRLAQEKSPYLLQHANNPVDWWPWGDAAFAEAKAQNKPVFLSVGYSTCHWCHVMERESFENPDIANLLNEHFISIKVDREERPDIDRVYMMVTQAMSGHGGWPMSVFLAPDRKPFFAGTYFPPKGSSGRPGFTDLIGALSKAWMEDQAKVLESANKIVEQLAPHTQVQATGDELSPDILGLAYAQIRAGFDETDGGFGGAPKFPQPSRLLFLLREHARAGDAQALPMVLKTLGAMANGGLRDHVGGGFHRYAVDGAWRVPHFEKMLYDQAQLVMAYVEGWQSSGHEALAMVARDTLNYVLSEMRSPEGAFYSAQDADSEKADAPGEKGEGAFFVWRAMELRSALGKQDAAVLSYLYGIKPEGNVAVDPQGEFRSVNILYQAHSVEEAAVHFEVPEEVVRTRVSDARQVLFEMRGQRPAPHLDDKVLAGWNGLMVSAFARAALAFGDVRFRDAAQASMKFIRSQMWIEKHGVLWRRYRDGEAAIPAQLEDYAFLVQGLLDLYECDFDVAWLQWAEQLLDLSVKLLWDEEAGGFLETVGDVRELPLQVKDHYDGAIPAGNSVAALNLLRMADLTDRDDLRARAIGVLKSFGPVLTRSPSAVPQALVALDYHMAPKRQIVLAGDPAKEDFQALLESVRRRFLPNRILLHADGGAGQATLAKRLKALAAMIPVNDKATAYVCQDFECRKPVHSSEDLHKNLDAVMES